MFGKRFMSSVVLVLIALVTILYGKGLLAITLLAISLVAFYELANACDVHKKGRKINALEGTAYGAITIYYILMYLLKSQQLLFMMIVLTFMALMFVYVLGFPKYTITQVMAVFFAVIYGSVMFSFIYLTREMVMGEYIVWLVFIGSWISDTCAYLVGMSIGKHKLAPVLSPKKSIEGSIGGILGSALVGGIYGYFVSMHIGGSWQDIVIAFVVIGAVGSVISQMGDLAASAIKRQHDLKDYGNLIPGHGGIMDRFDSVIVTSPMIYFLAVWFL
ncbi:MAG: phosphatidate cytidylyltransferase [Eubacteriales bacterium]